MRAGGKTESSMAKEFIERMVAIAEESGKTAKELNGSMIQSGLTLTMSISSLKVSIKKDLLKTEN
jgi:hypothetical protein